MKKIIPLLIAASIIFISVSGCSEEEQSDCKKGSNNVVTENRGLVSVKRIISNSPADIVISDTTVLFVRAEDNLLSYLATEVSNGLLTINLQGGCIENHFPFTVIAPAREISSITLNGDGDVTTQIDFVLSDLTTEIEGSGDIEYKSGNIELHQIEISGSGDVEARNIITGTTQITITGSGDCYVYAERELMVNISGSGDVFYKGNPQLNLNITGSGKVTKL